MPEAKLKEFLLKLASEDAFLVKYVRSPREAMTAYGLSSKAVEAVLAGDLAGIRELLGGEQVRTTTICHVISRNG
jgi:hypothetical protein